MLRIVIGIAAIVFGAGAAAAVEAEDLVLSSPAFAEGGAIPSKYTCDGEDLIPPLAWRGVPEGTRSLALVIVDPDVPDPAAPVRAWVHWVVYAIPPGSEGIPEGGFGHALLPGAKEGLNDWQRTRYGGPCPPIGKHRYIHRLYALDSALESLESPTKADLEIAMDGHVLDSATLVGTYERAKPKPQQSK